MSDRRMYEERKEHLLLSNTKAQNIKTSAIFNELSSFNASRNITYQDTASTLSSTSNKGHTGLSRRGSTGTTGVIGTTGCIGKIGQRGHTGIQGSQSTTGTTGPEGYTGTIGSMGPTGPKSITGSTGSIGATGHMGIVGKKGRESVSGSTGPVGATGVYGPVGPMGSVSITGSTGPIGNTGKAGLGGMQGPPTSTGSTGSVGQEGGQGPYCKFSVTGGTGEFGFGTMGVVGSTGPAGVTRGPVGAMGMTGDVGSTGELSTTGSTGPPGVGPKGTMGTRGVIGKSGPIGKMGATGNTGFIGTFGITGVMGHTGSGIIGQVGNRGVFGINGLTGPMGTTEFGAAGRPGVSGPQGSGIAGNFGATGPAGIVGVTGSTGLPGMNSITGSTGLSGSVGVTGTYGPYGMNSVTGCTGSSIGITGPSNGIGHTGPTGRQGGTGRPGITQGPTGSYIATTGPTGIVGVPGKTGKKGRVGPTGTLGATGKKGYSGRVGPYGPVTESVTGPVNKDGVTGSYGTTGTGVIGETGPAGHLGPVGIAGVTGAIGNSGSHGEKGKTGIGGIVGNTGATGNPSGIIGPRGPFVQITGLKGEIGKTGSTGVDGPKGAHKDNTGNTGERGSTGPGGLTGRTGYSHPGMRGSIGPMHPGYTGPIGHTGHVIPTNAELAHQNYKLVNITPLDASDGVIVALKYPSANTEISLDSRYGAFWGYRQDLWMVKDDFFLSSSSGSSDTTIGKIYDCAHVQLINGRRQSQGANDDYFTHTPSDVDNEGAAVRPGGYITFAPQGRYRFNFTRLYFDIWTDTQKSIRKFKDLRFKVLASNNGANWDVMEMSGKTTETDVFYVKDMIKDPDRYAPHGIISNFESNSQRPDMYYTEFLNTEYYSNWRLLHVHDDQSITQSDYMKQGLNYFSLPNSMSEIEFGGGWIPPYTLTVTGNVELRRPGTIKLTFSDADPLHTDAYELIVELSYTRGNHPKSPIEFNNRYSINKTTNQITISDYFVATAIEDHKVHVRMKGPNNLEMQRSLIGILPASSIIPTSTIPDVYHTEKHHTVNDHGYLPGLSGFPPILYDDDDAHLHYMYIDPLAKLVNVSYQPIVCMMIRNRLVRGASEIKIAKFRASNWDDSWWVVYFGENTQVNRPYIRITKPSGDVIVILDHFDNTQWYYETPGVICIGHVGGGYPGGMYTYVRTFGHSGIGSSGLFVKRETGSSSSFTQYQHHKWNYDTTQDIWGDEGTPDAVLYQGFNNTSVAAYHKRVSDHYNEHGNTYPTESQLMGFGSLITHHYLRHIDSLFSYPKLENFEQAAVPAGYRILFGDWRWNTWIKFVRLDTGSEEWGFSSATGWITHESNLDKKDPWDESTHRLFLSGSEPNISWYGVTGSTTKSKVSATISGDARWGASEGINFLPRSPNNMGQYVDESHVTIELDQETLESNSGNWYSGILHQRIVDNWMRKLGRNDDESESFTHMYPLNKYLQIGNFNSINLARAKANPIQNVKRPEDVRLGFYVSQNRGESWKQLYLKFVHNGVVKYTDTDRFLSDERGSEPGAWSGHEEYYITNQHYSSQPDGGAGWYEIVDFRKV